MLARSGRVRAGRASRARAGRSLVGAAALVVALAALTVAVFGVVYERQVGQLKRATEADYDRYTSLTGLTNQATQNVLDPRYTDANGDLVADAPTDPSKQIDPPTLRFTYISVEDDAPFRAGFKDLLTALSKATGKPVEFASYPDRNDKLRDLRDGKVAIAGLNTGAVPLGVCAAGFVPLVQAADAAGGTGAQMLVIVPAGSPLQKLADLKEHGPGHEEGHELILTDPASNSGYKSPLVLLRENGMLPPRDYQIRFSNGHVQSIEGIRDHRFEAAAVAGDVLARMHAAGQIKAADYRVIYTSDQTFPGVAIGCPSILKPELVKRIRDTLLDFDWKGTSMEKAFAAEGKVKFVPVNYKKDWEYVRRIDDSIGESYTLPAGPATAPLGPARSAAPTATGGTTGGRMIPATPAVTTAP